MQLAVVILAAMAAISPSLAAPVAGLTDLGSAPEIDSLEPLDTETTFPNLPLGAGGKFPDAAVVKGFTEKAGASIADGDVVRPNFPVRKRQLDFVPAAGDLVGGLTKLSDAAKTATEDEDFGEAPGTTTSRVDTLTKGVKNLEGITQGAGAKSVDELAKGVNAKDINELTKGVNAKDINELTKGVKGADGLAKGLPVPVRRKRQVGGSGLDGLTGTLTGLLGGAGGLGGLGGK